MKATQIYDLCHCYWSRNDDMLNCTLQSTDSGLGYTIVGFFFRELHKAFLRNKDNWDILPRITRTNNSRYNCWTYKQGDFLPTLAELERRHPRGTSLLSVGTQVALWNPIWKRFIRMRPDNNLLDKSGQRNDKSLPTGWTWEQFRVVEGKNGLIALWSPMWKHFLRMHRDIAQLDKSGRKDQPYHLPDGWTWERFKVIDAKDGYIALWNPTHRRFVRMPSGTYMDKSGIRDNGSLPSNWTWEKFWVVVVTATEM